VRRRNLSTMWRLLVFLQPSLRQAAAVPAVAGVHQERQKHRPASGPQALGAKPHYFGVPHKCRTQTWMLTRSGAATGRSDRRGPILPHLPPVEPARSSKTLLGRCWAGCLAHQQMLLITATPRPCGTGSLATASAGSETPPTPATAAAAIAAAAAAAAAALVPRAATSAGCSTSASLRHRRHCRRLRSATSHSRGQATGSLARAATSEPPWPPSAACGPAFPGGGAASSPAPRVSRKWPGLRAISPRPHPPRAVEDAASPATIPPRQSLDATAGVG